MVARADPAAIPIRPAPRPRQGRQRARAARRIRAGGAGAAGHRGQPPDGSEGARPAAPPPCPRFVGGGRGAGAAGVGRPGLEAACAICRALSRPRGVRIGYDEGLAHRMFAGADAVLVPSRFEPCGLTQMYGLRYGALPVVARTGGLADTVIHANDRRAGGGGGHRDHLPPHRRHRLRAGAAPAVRAARRPPDLGADAAQRHAPPGRLGGLAPPPMPRFTPPCADDRPAGRPCAGHDRRSRGRPYRSARHLRRRRREFRRVLGPCRTDRAVPVFDPTGARAHACPAERDGHVWHGMCRADAPGSSTATRPWPLSPPRRGTASTPTSC
jgi:hypothetical protein